MKIYNMLIKNKQTSWPIFGTIGLGTVKKKKRPGWEWGENALDSQQIPAKCPSLMFVGVRVLRPVGYISSPKILVLNNVGLN